MGRGSLKASSQGIEAAKKALLRNGLTQKALGEALGISRSTISKFFNGKTVERYVFEGICDRLHLNWEEIFQPPPEEEEQQNNSSQIDALVQEIRKKVRKNIEETCGTMRVLDMTQPIDLGSIYTQVKILEKITGRKRIDLNNLLEALNLENSEDFDRFGWSQVKEKRVEGEKAVLAHNKLMVLGKPGSGKTTFLKYLAIQCNKGEFLENCVPVFIPLKQFAETELENKPKPGLLDYISHCLGECKVTEAQTKALQLLEAGRAFVLLDGLDEVREEDSDRIIKEIREFSQQFSSSQFVITCRIAAKEYTFEQFTEVEVADFADKQIQYFSECWFKQKKLDNYAKDFTKQLKDNPQIKELATNPLLLTLLCLEFEDSRSFPADRAELYKRATETLLRKWDDKRGIKREQIYGQLSVKRKEDLLSQIAFETFKQKHYFFKRGIVENHIADYIINLPDAPTDTEKLHLDSGAVLKSIEAQHGLLVERAKGIYSFSHLTFQEYFTAQQIVSEQALPELVEHITEKSWREVFLLTAGMLQKADYLLQLMKEQVDKLLSKDEKLQEFLTWADRKSEFVERTGYKLAVVRFFYILLSLDLCLYLSLDLCLCLCVYLREDLSLDFSRYLSLYLRGDLRGDLSPELSVDPSRDLSRYLRLDLSLYFSLDLSLDLSLYLSLYLSLDLSRYLSLDLSRYLSLDLSRYLEPDISPEIQEALQKLNIQLPQEDSDIEIVEQWFRENGESWSNQLRDVMIKDRDIGQDWGFTKEQKESFLQYVDANNLLLDCLENNNNYITRRVREEIESTLYLPFKEVENQFEKTS